MVSKGGESICYVIIRFSWTYLGIFQLKSLGEIINYFW